MRPTSPQTVPRLATKTLTPNSLCSTLRHEALLSRQGHTRTLQPLSSNELAFSVALLWPRPISSKPELSRTALILGLQAHTGS